MKKILLIEDRVERQNKFLKNIGLNLDNYSFLDNKTSNKYNEFASNFSLDLIKDYDIIISHRSAFSKENQEKNINILDQIQRFCKDNKKKLVYFSGGISNISYQKIPYEFLQLNSKIFYSNNLKLFLDEFDNDQDILKLAYGKKYIFEHLLEVLDNIKKFYINMKNEECYYDDFLIDSGLEELKNIDFLELSIYEKNNKIAADEIKKIYNKLAENIKEKGILNEF